MQSVFPASFQPDVQARNPVFLGLHTSGFDAIKLMLNLQSSGVYVSMVSAKEPSPANSSQAIRFLCVNHLLAGRAGSDPGRGNGGITAL
jgi:hypothetical protein